MLLSGSRLYVDAHAGGLLELAASSGGIRWAYSYRGNAGAEQQYVVLGLGRRAAAVDVGPSGPMVAGGQLSSRECNRRGCLLCGPTDRP